MISQTPIADSEIARPTWRSGAAYTNALGDEAVSDRICNVMLALRDPQAPVSVTPEAELTLRYPDLRKDLRVVDLGEHTYWFVMLGLCGCFLVSEFFVTRYFSSDHNGLKYLTNALIGSLIVLVVLGAVYAYAVLTYLTQHRLPRFIRGLEPQWLHAAPVIWVSATTLVINLIVVWQTGFSRSPFLPTLLTSAVMTLSLPRENSRPVVILAILSIVIGLSCALPIVSISTAEIEEWGGQSMATALNAVTFVFSAVSVVVLRKVANYKVMR